MSALARGRVENLAKHPIISLASAILLGGFTVHVRENYRGRGNQTIISPPFSLHG